MNRIAVCGLAFLLSFSPVALAQESPAGRYSGSYTMQTTDSYTVGLTLDVASVEDGKVKALLLVSSRTSCRGEYPMEGIYKNNELRIRSTRRGGASGDCSVIFRGKREGNAFVGKIGEYDVTLRK